VDLRDQGTPLAGRPLWQGQAVFISIALAAERTMTDPPGRSKPDPMTARDRQIIGVFRERTEWFPDRTDKP
jgi:hypothetical protein